MTALQILPAEIGVFSSRAGMLAHYADTRSRIRAIPLPAACARQVVVAPTKDLPSKIAEDVAELVEPSPMISQGTVLFVPDLDQHDSHVFTWWKALRATPRTPRLAVIQKVCAAAYGIDVMALKSPRRTAAVMMPRQIALYLSRTMTAKSFPEIGRLTGGKDHTTVLHSVRRVKTMRAESPALDIIISELERKILFAEGLSGSSSATAAGL